MNNKLNGLMESSFLDFVLMVGSFVGGIVAYRVINDVFTEHVAKKSWYPYSANYIDPKRLGPKGPVLK